MSMLLKYLDKKKFSAPLPGHAKKIKPIFPWWIELFIFKLKPDIQSAK